MAAAESLRLISVDLNIAESIARVVKNETDNIFQ